MSSGFDFSVIGLEIRDKRVYEALAASPGSSLRKIAAETGINRGSVYESIKKLAEQGLVGSIEIGKQRRYSIASPAVITELIRERRELLANAEQGAADYIRTLTAAETTPDEAPFATYFVESDGVAAVLRDVLATCRDSAAGSSYRVISTKNVSRYMYENFRNFTQRRIAEKISVRVIGVENSLPTTTEGTPDALSERRTMSATRGESPNCYTLIYGDKTAFISLDDRSILSAIVIDNPGITHLQKELFDRLWKNLPQTNNPA